MLDHIAGPGQKTGPSARERFVSVLPLNMQPRDFVHDMVDVGILFDGRVFANAGIGQAVRVVQ